MSGPIFDNVTVLGAGTMGAGIAQVCAQAGASVCLFDVHQAAVDAGRQRIDSFLQKGVDKGKLTANDRDAALARIRSETDLVAASADAALVVEAVPEKVDLKNRLFREVVAHAGPECVLATNTSSLSLRQIFEGVERPQRCIGMHFFNPVPIMALLEVVRTEQTSQECIDRVLCFAGQIGKEPVLVKDSPGFATSRLGVCLGLEAIRMVEAGVASAQDIDKAMELGYRHPMGPLRLTDLVGLDVRMNIADYLCEALGSDVFAVPQLMRDMVARGELGQKSGKGFYAWG